MNSKRRVARLGETLLSNMCALGPHMNAVKRSAGGDKKAFRFKPPKQILLVASDRRIRPMRCLEKEEKVMKTRNRLFWTMPCLAVILFVAASVQAQEMTAQPAMQAAILAEFSIFGDFRQSDNVPFAQQKARILG